MFEFLKVAYFPVNQCFQQCVCVSYCFPFISITVFIQLKVLEKSTAEIQNLVNIQIENSRETFEPSNVNNFVDLYLKNEAENVKDELISRENGQPDIAITIPFLIIIFYLTYGLFWSVVN